MRDEINSNSLNEEKFKFAKIICVGFIAIAETLQSPAENLNYKYLRF